MFIIVITARLKNKLHAYQPPEQAEFRRGFNALDHLQVMRTLIEKLSEYNITFWIAFVDYGEAFDSVENWAILHGLSNDRIDSRYSRIIKNIYKDVTFQVILKETINKIKMRTGVRQEDAISSKLFTLALEDLFNEFGWDRRGMMTIGEYLSHLPFAYDIVPISLSKKGLQKMLIDLNNKSKESGLKVTIKQCS